MKKLNLGCGKTIKQGWINLDFIKGEGVDVVWNLDKFPYPFKDNEFDYILLDGILEHLENPERVIKELWRISKKGADILIRVAHFSCWQAWGDITHKRTFNHTSLFPFSDKLSHRGSSSLINKKTESFKMNAKITFGKIKKALGFEKIININNASRGFYEQNFAYLFPADAIEFKLKTIK